MPKPKQTWVKRKCSEPRVCDVGKKRIRSFIWLCGQKSVFWWLVSMQLVMKVEHHVLRQDTGEISPGRGRGGEEKSEGSGRWGRRVVQVYLTGKDGTLGGLISRLCVHFFLGFASRGCPISFPRSFIPIHNRRGTQELYNRQLRHNKHDRWIQANSILLTNHSLYLAQDLVVGNRFPALVVCNDLRLLINFLRKRFDMNNLQMYPTTMTKASNATRAYKTLPVAGTFCFFFLRAMLFTLVQKTVSKHVVGAIFVVFKELQGVMFQLRRTKSQHVN